MHRFSTWTVLTAEPIRVAQLIEQSEHGGIVEFARMVGLMPLGDASDLNVPNGTLGGRLGRVLGGGVGGV